MTPLHRCARGFYHDFAPIFLSAGRLGTPVAVCHVVLRLAQPMRHVTAEAGHAQQATTSVLQRTPSVCGPDAQAPLRLVCARDGTSPSAPSRATRSDVPDEPAAPGTSSTVPLVKDTFWRLTARSSTANLLSDIGDAGPAEKTPYTYRRQAM
jgi:hypothetical protein